MPNSLKLNQGSPAAGLGTFSFTPTSTGLYNVDIKTFLPFRAAGDLPQSTVPSAEVTDVTCAADTAGSRNNTYFTFNSACDAYGFYVWFNINAAGTDPAVSGRTGIEVAGATGATAATLAAAARTAIAANSLAASCFAVGGATTHVILTNKQMGQCTNAANGAGGASAGATFSITQGSFGVPEQSGLTIKIYNNSVLASTMAFPSPTQPVLGGNVSMAVTAGNAIDIVLASLSGADSELNAVKSVINISQG